MGKEKEVDIVNISEEFGLNDRQTMFCLFYLVDFNAPLAAEKAGYYRRNAWRLLKNPKIAAAINRLKKEIKHKPPVEAEDVLKMYAKIAFADVFDYVKLDKNGKLRLCGEPDGQVVREVATTARGVRLQLCDRMKALEKLEKYLNLLPEDWRKALEMRKLELMAQGKNSTVNVYFDMPEPDK